MFNSSNIHIFNRLNSDIVFDPSTMEAIEPSPLQLKILRLCNPQKNIEQVISSKKLIDYTSDQIRMECNELVSKGFLVSSKASLKEIKPFVGSFELVLNISQSCNLDCSYCFSDNKKQQHMSFDTASKAIDLFLDYNSGIETFKLSFFGGEPLMNYKTLKQSVFYAKERARLKGIINIQFFIITNGTLLSDDLIHFFDEHHFEVQVSIDGEEKTHDENRKYVSGKGSFQKTFSNFNKLFETNNIRVSTSSVISGKNPLSNVYEFLKDYPLEHMKMDFFQNFQQEKLIEFDNANDDSVEEYTHDLEKLASEYLSNLESLKIPSEYNFKQGIMMLWHKKFKKVYCPASFGRFGVSFNGNIYPCGAATSMKKYQLGNINSGVDKRSLADFRTHMSVNSVPKCESCWAKPLCLGGCPLTFQYEYSENYCKIRKAMAECSIAIYTKIRSDNPLGYTVLTNPGFAEILSDYELA